MNHNQKGTSEKEGKDKKGLIKLIVFAVLVLAMFGLNHYFGWSKMFMGDDWYGQLRNMVDTNFAMAALIYIVVMVVACVLLAVPGVTFAIIAGAIFGPWMGTLLCTLAATIGAILSFLVGRFFLKDSLRDKVASNKYMDRLLFNSETKNEMTVLMVTRLVPIFPFNLQNFAYGITDISLAKYSIGTFLFMIPGTAMYTFGVSAIADAKNRILYIVLTILLIVTVTFVSKWVRKKYVPEDAQD